MNVTLTGATGFIGKRLVARLLSDQHRLHVLARKRPQDLPAEVEFSAWNATEQEPPEAALANADAVLHLAGEPVAQRWTADVKRRILESRSLGTRHLVHALSTLSRRPKVLVSASASGYYGDRGEEVLSESSPPGRGFLVDVCQAWESEALMAESLGLRVAMVRVGIVLGKEGGALKQMLPPFRAGVGGRLGSGQQWMSWIHVDDLVNLFVHAIQADSASGPLNGVAPNPVRNADFSDALGAVLHRPAILPAPRFALKLMFGEMAEIILASQCILPRRTEQTGFDYQYPALMGALKQVLA